MGGLGLGGGRWFWVGGLGRGRGIQFVASVHVFAVTNKQMIRLAKPS